MSRPALMATGGALVLLGAALLAWPAFASGGKGQFDLKFINKPTLITAAYKVYGNAEAVGGKYWLGKLTLRNSGPVPIRDVKISYQIPTYVSWTTPESFPEVLPGQTIVSAIYPRLPSNVTQITSMTPTSLEVKIEYDDGTGAKSRIERRDFQFRGVREIEYSSLPSTEIVDYYDMHDNSELNCAWVTEEDDAVRAYYTKISERAGGFGTMDSGKDLEQLARSTYDFMVTTGMTYSGTKGLAEKKGDDYVLVQSMRLPRDIIYGNSGLCVELAQLWASIAINSGARCYLAFIPGHCFPVLASGDGTLIPIESTGISGAFQGGNLGAPMPFEKAVESASASFLKLRKGEIPGLLIDVLEYRNEGIRPPELGSIDRPAFIKMLDDRLASGRTPPRLPTAPPQQQASARPQETGGGGACGGEAGGGGGVAPMPMPNPQGNAWADPRGRVSLSYPPTWQLNPQLVQQMQRLFSGYVLSCVDPRTQWGVEVIFFNGIDDHEDALDEIEDALDEMGLMVVVGDITRSRLGGKASTTAPVMITSPAGMVAGTANVVSVPGGVVVINVGGPPQNMQAALPAVQQILNSIRFGQ